ncbi:G patch domain-containing protein 1 isoform X2 [Melospiza georgiana]|uniref:G patch domain-containing protein 1 isoform X2 n=1 Tax=Melospiza georgiana TaxID=44398 RepID=UPI0025AC0131|nr:G patch domain-containing protein 1 isoform X2 [Melospiza georgiana]
MAESSDSEEEDLVSYGSALQPLQEGERIKKPVPLQEQTVKDAKGRYQRFHGAFTGGFSAGYFNTVGTKEGWTPSAFVSSRQKRADRTVFGPEDFMDEEDLSEFGIAPKDITTTDDFASKAKDRIKEKARQIAGVVAPIPGTTAFDDLIGPSKITVGVELLRKMGWKEGQGIGPRVKRKPRRQKPDPTVKIYGCALPPGLSEGSEDEEDEYQPENVTFAPKDVMPVDLTPKENVHGLGYKGLDPSQALFGASGREHLNLFTGGSEETSNLLGDLRHSKGRKLGITGQAFGVGALEEEDDDIYATDTLSKYDTVLKDEEPGDGLYGWTAPKQYKSKKRPERDFKYIGKVLAGFSLASKPSAPVKIYPPPSLPRTYRPVHHFRPVLPAGSESCRLQRALEHSAGKLESDPAQHGRHALSAAQRREQLGEAELKGPAPSVLEYLSEKDRERLKQVKQASEQQMKAKPVPQQSPSEAKPVPQQSPSGRFQLASREDDAHKWQTLLGGQLANAGSSDFKPFAKNPEKQKRYENFVKSLKQGERGERLERFFDQNMTEWERGREQEEFFRAAMFYRSSNSTLSSRFTRAKYEDDVDKVEVPRDQENDIDDKETAVKMKMFGKLTRDNFEWHPDKLLCKRFNVRDPYPDSSVVGLPKVKRDKYSVFNFLTVTEPTTSATQATNEKIQESNSLNKPKKSSRWDVSDKEKEKKDSISEFISLARSKADAQQQPPVPAKEECGTGTTETPPSVQAADEDKDQEEESKRPPMDLFKAIFVSSSDEKSSSSEEEESDEEEQPATSERQSETTKPVDVADSSSSNLQDNVTATTDSGIPSLPTSKQELDAAEEFGPKLPPAFSSGTTWQQQTEVPATFPGPSKKEKHRKIRERHKAKKERKRKKEKKKKHKKQKNKGKHKNKKSEKESSSDTTDSSDSLSDMDTTGLSPKELLRRLKQLQY